MPSPLLPLPFLSLLLLLLLVPCHSATCSSQKFSNNKHFDFCNDLSTLNAALHWTYDSSKSSLDIAFIAPPPKSNGWASWAINPTGTGMVGSQALIAFKQPDGLMTVKTFDIQGYSINQSPIAFEVSDMVGEYKDERMMIFATIALPKNTTTLNHVWQVGASVVDGVPDAHAFAPGNLNSMGNLALLEGKSVAPSGTDTKLRFKYIHGVLNAVSWGILMPIGVIIARYLRPFKSADPAWFNLHVGCQFSSFVIGVAGWATGMKLGADSEGVQYTNHRNIGITLFCLGTLQVLALILRPNKDHKYRFYWNIYHHSVGYTVIILSIINCIKGTIILNVHKWRTTYIAIIVILAVVTVVLEVLTTIILSRRKSNAN